MGETEGRVAMISGANRGIGAAIAREMLTNGWRVSLGVRDPGGLADAVAPGSDSCLHATFDAVVPDTASAWVQATASRFGRIDALVNNAGSGEFVRLMDDNDEALDRLWAINCKAPLRLTRLVVPHLEQVGEGRIVNIASLSGKRVRNGFVGYNMTKFAVMGLTHTTRHETWDKGIRCTAVCPSFVRTEMSSYTSKIAPEDMIQAETLARMIRNNIELPNNAAVAEILVNCRLEDML